MKKIYFLCLIVVLFSYGCGGVVIPALVGGGVAMKVNDTVIDQGTKEIRTIRVKTTDLEGLKKEIKEIMGSEGYKVYNSGEREIKLERENCFKIKFSRVSEYVKLEISDCSFFWNQFPGGKMGTAMEKSLILDQIRQGLAKRYKVLI